VTIRISTAIRHSTATPDEGRSLLEDLRAHDIEEIYIGGLATDYCVRESVLDARRAGVRVTVLEDAVAGIDMKRGDSDRAIAAMSVAGAHVATSQGWPFTL
jgi:nicotinamidase/pyrazinamidase